MGLFSFSYEKNLRIGMIKITKGPLDQGFPEKEGL
jgi:hypothetical protein